jgi:hypothetical protein
MVRHGTSGIAKADALFGTALTALTGLTLPTLL